MKEKILKLRAEGKTYKEIAEEIGCAKSTVSYHCSADVRIKAATRMKENKAKPLYIAIDRFKYTDRTLKLRSAAHEFSRNKDKSSNYVFGYKQVIEKFGEVTKCYLTGESINLLEDKFNFDHIIPASRGGENTLDNLGITTPIANHSKSSMTVEEYLELCKKVLTYHGYKISK